VSNQTLIKKYINGAKIIKEEKDQGFKRQNYYYNNRDNYGRRNSFNGHSVFSK
jgi:hypothetical protein